MRLIALLLLYGLFLLSGGTALVYQVAWLRDLSLIFGASFQATSIVLASFMGGMALGGFFFGRMAERLGHPLRVYGVLEVGIALFALALPSLLGQVDSLYANAALRAGEVTPGLSWLRITLSFAVLALPTFLMGGTLPVLIRLVAHSHDELASRLAWLYGINTLGAAAGALVAGFVLLPTLGVVATEQAAVAVNLAIGLLAVTAAAVVPDTTAEVAEPELESAAGLPSDLDGLPARLAFMGTMVAGLTALALEVMWTRALTLSVGSTTYAFTVMLAAFLIGIWLGSWIHAVLPLRRIHVSVQFGAVLILIGGASFVVSQAIPRLSSLVVNLNLFLYRDVSGLQPATILLAAFAVMLVPSIFMGIAFPLAAQARARLAEGFGKSVGDTVGLNTLGAIAGSLLAGFVLIPAMGLQNGMLSVAMLDAGYGLVVLAAAYATRFRRARLQLSAAAVVAVILVVGVPRVTPRWDLEALGTFTTGSLNQDLRGGRAFAPVLSRSLRYFEEGRSSTVAVMDVSFRKKQVRSISINGKTVASDLPADVLIELLLGHVPALVHPGPKTALVVGLGAGVTLGAVAAHRGIEEIVLVEIEPAVFGGAALFSHVNGDVLNDPRLEVVIQDGRNYLKTTPRRFDLITADPIHPWAAGSAYLYTTDYYGLASQRLNQGGVMTQWVPLSELSVENLRSIVGSFSENFEHVSVWSTAADIVLLGSREPMRVDLERLAARLEEPEVKEQLGWVVLSDPVAFLSRLVAEGIGVRAFSRDAILNTDDNLYIEFSSPLAMGTSCRVQTVCGLAAYYPARLELISNWSSLFDSAEEGRMGVRRYRDEHPNPQREGTMPLAEAAPQAL